MKTYLILSVLLVVSCTPVSNSPCTGTNGDTMSCSSGYCSQSGGAGCSAKNNGVACCTGGGGGGGGGNGTVMGCSPATGCGTLWLNECDMTCGSSTGGSPCSTHRQ